jgi:hypothetical protein
VTWDQVDQSTLQLPDQLYLGYSVMTDSGAGTPPISAYANNGHTLDAADPLGPTLMNGNAMNEANYASEVVQIFPKWPPQTQVLGAITVSRQGTSLRLSWQTGKLQSATSVSGPWALEADQSNPLTVVPTGAAKFYRLVP